MNGQTPWLKEIIETLVELGGQGTLADIYSSMENRGQINLSNYTDWKAQIRKHIYLNSGDTDKIFKGKPGDASDIFYSIEGLVWYDDLQ